MNPGNLDNPQKRAHNVIRCSQLSKRFQRIAALDGVDLEIAAGSRVGLLGPNGAGKTTLLRCLVGFLAADSGTLLVQGINVLEEPTLVAKGIGFLPEGAPAYRDMQVGRYLRMRGQLKGLTRAEAIVARIRMLERVGLTTRCGSRIGNLSRGMRQRLGLADALLTDPSLLVLDEPTSGLDPAQLRGFISMVKELAVDRTLIFSSHRLDAVSALCDDAVVMAKGKIVFHGPLDELAGHGSPPDLERAYLDLTEEADLNPSPSLHANTRQAVQD